MNKMVKTNRREIALLAAVLTLAAILAGCSKEPSQQEPTAQNPTVIETEIAETSVPQETTVPEETTAPEETEAIETVPGVKAPEAGSISYAEYLELTPEEQQAYYEKFESPDDFFAWLNPAKEEYAESLATKPVINGNGEETAETSPIYVGEESVEDWE